MILYSKNSDNDSKNSDNDSDNDKVAKDLKKQRKRIEEEKRRKAKQKKEAKKEARREFRKRNRRRLAEGCIFIGVTITKIGLNVFKITFYCVKNIPKSKEFIVSVVSLVLSFQIYKTSLEVKEKQVKVNEQIEKIDRTRERSHYIDQFLLPVSSSLILKFSDGFIATTREKAAELTVKGMSRAFFGNKNKNIQKLGEENKELISQREKTKLEIQEKDNQIIELGKQTEKKQEEINTSYKKKIDILKKIVIGINKKSQSEIKEKDKIIENLKKKHTNEISEKTTELNRIKKTYNQEYEKSLGGFNIENKKYNIENKKLNEENIQLKSKVKALENINQNLQQQLKKKKNSFARNLVEKATISIAKSAGGIVQSVFHTFKTRENSSNLQGESKGWNDSSYQQNPKRNRNKQDQKKKEKQIKEKQEENNQEIIVSPTYMSTYSVPKTRPKSKFETRVPALGPSKQRMLEIGVFIMKKRRQLINIFK